MTSHYLYANLLEVGGEDLAPRVLTNDFISEVSQYNFDMNNLTVTSKYAKLPKNDKDSCGTEGLENISNRFKLVIIMDLPNTIEIVSIASRQARVKNMKSDISSNSKFYSKEQQPTSLVASAKQSEDKATIKSSLKRQQNKSVKIFNQYSHKKNLPLMEAEPEMKFNNSTMYEGNWSKNWKIKRI